MSTVKLEVVTPDKTVITEDVEMVICPGSEGEFGVLPQHISLLSALKIGSLRYRKDGKDECIFISGGFADVNNNKCSVLAESAEMAADIDQARAMEAKQRAEKRLVEHSAELDEVRAEAALRRAIVRLEIAQKAI